jgi:hypothetical protein
MAVGDVADQFRAVHSTYGFISQVGVSHTAFTWTGQGRTTVHSQLFNGDKSIYIYYNCCTNNVRDTIRVRTS